MKKDVTQSIKEALLKLGLPNEILYDEFGNIKPEYDLTELEKQALLYYIGTDAYKRKSKIVHDSEMAKFFREEEGRTL